jgi:hypothetical protein
LLGSIFGSLRPDLRFISSVFQKIFHVQLSLENFNLNRHLWIHLVAL